MMISTLPTSSSIVFTEQSVVELISILHQRPHEAPQASNGLTLFQTSPQAWDISISLLIYTAPAPPSGDSLQLVQRFSPHVSSFTYTQGVNVVPPELREVIAFFAAQTICVLCQSGFESLCLRYSQPGESDEETLVKIRYVLTELIWCYRSSGSSPTTRQLTQAVSASIIFSLALCVQSLPSEPSTTSTQKELLVINGDCRNGVGISKANYQTSSKSIERAEPEAERLISELLERYGRSSELFPALLEVLSGLPHDISSKKIAITNDQRTYVSYLILKTTNTVWNAVANIFDTISPVKTSNTKIQRYEMLVSNQNISSLTSITLRRLVMRCFQTWLEARSKYQRHSESHQSVCELPDLPHEDELIKESSVLTILLLNWETAICQFLSEVSISGPLPAIPDPNVKIDPEFHVTESLLGSLLTSASDALVECLDFLYVSSAFVPTLQDGLIQSLPLLNRNNIEGLLTIFKSVVRINGLIRRLTASVGTLRTAVTEVPNLLAGVDVRIIPAPVLRAIAVVMGKFAEVFLPALIFCLQFDGLDPDELLAAEVAMPDKPQKLQLLNDAGSLFNLMMELLGCECLEYRHMILDFWFALIGNQFTQQQAQLESSQNALLALKEENGIGTDMIALDEAPCLITSTFDLLIPALMRLAMFPSNIVEQQETFPYEAWVKYRDEVAMNLTDATAVLGSQPIIEKAGAELLQILEGSTCTIESSWQRVEVCFFVLTTVAPRAMAGKDIYIPKALEALPSIPYPAKGPLESIIISCAVGKFILWTAGYIGSYPDLFAKCFQLLYKFIPGIAHHVEFFNQGVPEVEDLLITQPEFHLFLTYCERVLVEAMNSIVTAVAPDLAGDSNIKESDIRFVLNGLADLVMIQSLSLESRCSLVISACSLLESLPIAKMQRYHFQLGNGLYTKATESLPIQAEPGSINSTICDNLKLFFVSLESVKPVRFVPTPNPSPNAVPLERGSEYRHPVLNVMEEFWSLFERCLVEFSFSEVIVEHVGHCVIKIFSQAPQHAVRYTLFHSFLQSLSISFLKNPSVFHLGALRSVSHMLLELIENIQMLGIFGMNSEPPIQKSLNMALVTCTESVLKSMKEIGSHSYVSMLPDVAGMTLDCSNTALSSPILSTGLLEMEAFQYCLHLSITITPECHHPKVLMTMMVFMLRYISWLEPVKTSTPTTFGGSRSKEDDWTTAANKASATAQRLAKELNLIESILKSVIRATTEIFQGNTQWLGIIGSLLVELFGTTEWAEPTKVALFKALQECPRHIVPNSLVDETVKSLTSEEVATNHRSVCMILQRLADQSEANWQKYQFAKFAK